MSTDRDHKWSQYHYTKSSEIVPITDKQSYYLQKQSTPAIVASTRDNKSARRGIYHQIISTCAVLLLSAACGMPIGYSAVLLPQLAQNNENTTQQVQQEDVVPEILIDFEMASWIASIHSLATPLGSLISGPLADFIGRRTTLLISVIPIMLGWCVLAMAKSYYMLIIGRLLCGFATGILGGPAQVYIAETAEPNLRSLLIGAPFVSYSMGILIVYALGSFMSWRVVAWCGNILPALAGAAIFCIPESPAWLLRNKKTAAAHKALVFLRGHDITAQKELNEMENRLELEKASMTTNENIFKLCCQRVAIKPLFIVITFATFQMFSGTFIVVFYAIDIIKELGVDINANAAANLTALVRMLCTLAFCVILLFVKRRKIMLLSSVGSGLSCLILSCYLYLCTAGSSSDSVRMYVSGICLLTYIAFNTALMVMPGIMIGELFPAKIRGRTAGGVFAAMNVALFSLTKLFPYIQMALKMQGVFMIFGIASFMVFIFMYLFQPETKGRSLQEIEDYFNGNNWLWFKRDKRVLSS